MPLKSDTIIGIGNLTLVHVPYPGGTTGVADVGGAMVAPSRAKTRARSRKKKLHAWQPRSVAKRVTSGSGFGSHLCVCELFWYGTPFWPFFARNKPKQDGGGGCKGDSRGKIGIGLRGALF